MAASKRATPCERAPSARPTKAAASAGGRGCVALLKRHTSHSSISDWLSSTDSCNPRCTSRTLLPRACNEGHGAIATSVLADVAFPGPILRHPGAAPHACQCLAPCSVARLRMALLQHCNALTRRLRSPPHSTYARLAAGPRVHALCVPPCQPCTAPTGQHPPLRDVLERTPALMPVKRPTQRATNRKSWPPSKSPLESNVRAVPR